MDMTMILLDRVIELRRALARAAPAAFTGDITARQAAVLRELRASGPASQVSLSRATAIDPSFMVRMLDDLEKRGLVRRKRSEADRRQVTVSLTAAGTKALGPVNLAYERLAKAVEHDLTTEERAAFLVIAGKMSRSLEALTASSTEVRHGQR